MASSSSEETPTQPPVVAVHGYTAAGFEPVARVFGEGFADRPDKGAALAIYYKGSLVVNLWGGMADASSERPWKEETYGHFWSGTKFMASVVIAQLVERGVLDYEEKLATYWPEFGQNGKEDITLNSLLSHTAGVSLSKVNYKLSWMRDDPKYLTKFLAELPPLWTPGTEIGYSAILLGLYLNEIVQRVDSKGRNVSQYFAEEIAIPCGIDFHIGLPKTLFYKVSRTTGPPSITPEAKASFRGNQDFAYMIHTQPMDLDMANSNNNPDFINLASPSTHGIGTAKGAAKLAGIIANGGEYEKKRVLGKTSIEGIQNPLSHGIDLLLSRPVAYGRGTNVFPVRRGKKNWFVSAHMGYGGQVVLCDAHNQVGLAYCCNFLDPTYTFGHSTWKQAMDALYACIDRLEGRHDGEVTRLYVSHNKFHEDTGVRIGDVVSKL